MTGIVITPGFKELVENDSILTGLKQFELDHWDSLVGLGGITEDGPVSLSSTQIVWEGTNPSMAPQDYTLTISGTGIGPVGSFAALEQALRDGTANGTFHSASITHGSTEILSVDLAPGSYTLDSGAQSVEIAGSFPTTLEELGELVMMVDDLDDFLLMSSSQRAELLETLTQYDITGVTLSDGGTTLLDLDLDLDAGMFTMAADGYTLEAAWEIPPLGDLVAMLLELQLDWFESGIERPHLRLYDGAGNLIDEDEAPAPDPGGTGSHGGFASIEGFSPESGGTYYLSAGAADDAEKGFYTLEYYQDGVSGEWGILEEGEDAPQDATTPYELPLGEWFSGALFPEGDRDWVEVALEAGESYDFYLGGFREGGFTGTFDVVLGPVTLTDPDGEVIFHIPETDLSDLTAINALITEINELLAGLDMPPLPVDVAWNTGDPHILTLDGAAYDFHAAGEYVMTRDITGTTDFEVQARMSPVGANVSANVAAAVRLDGGDVMISAAEANPFSIDGVTTEITDGGFVDVGHDRVYRDGDSYTVFHTTDGDFDTGYSAVVVDVVGDRVDITVALDDAWMGGVEGLLGNFNGNAADDIALADGTALARPLAFDDLYGAYRDDWRVDAEADSLFAYRAGESVDGFYLPDYPTGMIGPDDFSAEERADAEAAAEAAGLTPGTVNYNNAVLDYLLTGDESYIDTARDTVESTPETVDVPGTDGGGLDGLMVLSGSLSDIAGAGLAGGRVLFRPEGKTVDLAARPNADGDFALDLSAGAAGRLDAARDFQDGDPAITAVDALDVLRIAVGLNPSWGPATAENFIAADIDQNGAVTAQDALEVLRAAVGLAPENAPRWVFVDSDDDLAGVTGADNVTYDTGIDIAALGSDVDVSMTGILLGNMEAV